MSHANSKTLDIILEEHADFGFMLAFESTTEQCIENPLTGEQTHCSEVRTLLDMSNTTFRGEITDSLDESASLLGSFSFSMISADKGVVYMTMPKERIAVIVGESSPGTINRRKHVGFYDILAIDNPTGAVTRVMEGKVYTSIGVTM